MQRFKSNFGDFGDTSPIMHLTGNNKPRGLSPFEMAQLGLNANFEAKKRRNALRTQGKSIMELAAKSGHDTFNNNNQAELRRVRANQEKAALIPPMPTFAPPPPPNRSMPPVPKRSLPTMTSNQKQQWKNLTRKHPSILFGKKQPTRPLPPLPIEGARRKTRRTRKTRRHH